MVSIEIRDAPESAKALDLNVPPGLVAAADAATQRISRNCLIS
jgi:hypothetical protein